MSDSEEIDDIDIDFKDESWLQDDQDTESEESTEKLKIDASKIDRELVSKTVLIDYIRERIKQTYNKRILISDEGEKALLKVVERNLRKYLDNLSHVVVDLVIVSDLKTIFRRHILCGDKVLSGCYTDFAGCETNETGK